MKLQGKIFFLSSTAAILLGGPLLWTVRQSVHRILLDEVGQRGLLAAEQLVEHVAPTFRSASERVMLPMLQAAQEQTGALYVQAIDPSGRVLAHTNVAEKGKVYTDQDTQEDLRARVSHAHPVMYKGSLIMEVLSPVWLRSEAPMSEDFMLNGTKDPSSKEYLGIVELGLPLGQALATEYRLFRRIAGVVLLAGGFGIILFFLFMRRLLRPVQWLSLGTSRISKGDYGAQVPVRTKDELGDLAQGFNRMSRVLAETTVSRDVLEEKERYFRSLIENTSDLITVLAPDSTIRYESPSVGKVLGYRPEELVGSAATTWIHPEDHPNVLKTLQEASHSPGKSYYAEFRFKHKDGSWRILDSVGTFISNDATEPRFVINSRDVTERKLSEQQRLLLFAAIEQSKDSIVITNADGTVQYVNRAFETASGYSRHDAVGQNPRVLKSGKHDRAFYDIMWSTLTAGRVWEGILINKRKDGILFEEEACICPVTNEAGSITNYVAVKRSIAERRKLEAIVRQSDKMSAVGQLAAGVAHEINNPLGVILGFAQALVRRLQANDPLEMPLKSIEKEAVRCKNLVQDLLTFSRASKADRKPVDINRSVEGALSLITAQARMAHIEVKKDLAPELPHIFGNHNQIQQVIINLASNAMDAMGDKGVLNIKTNHGQEGSMSWVCLRVEDTGPGIAPEILSRVFDPFFTTKPVGKGTGLGLSLVHEIVQKHSGTIEVESHPGRTEFIIKFPVHSYEKRPSAPQAPQ